VEIQLSIVLLSISFECIACIYRDQARSFRNEAPNDPRANPWGLIESLSGYTSL